MHSVYLCPLTNGSQFCLSRAATQSNCNATADMDAMTSEDVTSFPNSYEPQNSQQSQVLALSSKSGSAAARTGEETKRVGFAAFPNPSAKRKVSHQRSPSSRRAIELKDGKRGAPCSLLVPLTSNQSNLQCLTNNKSKNNAQLDSSTATQEKSGCDVGEGKASGRAERGDLMAESGVRYWNVYEYQDFRQVIHGQGHLFDPQLDVNLHREGIILDNYNRLLKSYPRFRMPVPVYHVR